MPQYRRAGVAVKASHAQQLIDLWKKDYIYDDLPQETRSVFEARYGFIARGTFVRVIIGAKNKGASDALFDGRFGEALNWLKKYGLKEKPNPGYFPTGTKALDRRTKAIKALRTEWWEAAKHSNWKTVK